MLEAELGTNVPALCLNDPVNATQTVLNNKEQLLKKDFSNLLISAKGSAHLAASIASKVSWRHLWDIALEKGVKGTKIIFRAFSGRYAIKHHASSACSVNLMYPLQLHVLSMHVNNTRCNYKIYLGIYIICIAKPDSQFLYTCVYFCDILWPEVQCNVNNVLMQSA